MQVKFEILGAPSVRKFVVRMTATANDGTKTERTRVLKESDLVMTVEGENVTLTAQAVARLVGSLTNSAEVAERERVACDTTKEWDNGEPFALPEDTEPEQEPEPENPSEGDTQDPDNEGQGAEGSEENQEPAEDEQNNE